MSSLADLLSFSVHEGTEKIAGLFFARRDQYARLHYALQVTYSQIESNDYPKCLMSNMKLFKTWDHCKNIFGRILD